MSWASGIFAGLRGSRWALPAIVAIILAALGVWQQLGFSLQMGELAFFKNAYDEDTYALFAIISETTRLDRLASASVLRLVLQWTDGFDLAFVLADIVLPAAAFLACFYLTGKLFRTVEVRVLWALVILFAPDLFSLGSAASPTADLMTLSSFRALFGEMGAVLVPPIDTSYLNVFRSFEPQLAYVAGFLFIGQLLKIFHADPAVNRPVDLVVLGLLQGFVLTTYSVVGYPLLAIELYVAILLFVSGRRPAALVLIAYSLVSLIIVVLAASAVLDGTSLVFSSRLPSIGVSTIASAALCLAIAASLARRRFADRHLWLALGVSGLPILLLNQQLLSGVMVSARDWERYITHPLMVIGAAVFVARLSSLRPEHQRPAAAWVGPASLALIAGTLVFAVNGTSTTRQFWTSLNETSLAMSRAIAAAEGKAREDVQIVLDDVSLAPLIAVRSGRPLDFIVDYTDVFMRPIPSSTEQDYEVPASGFDLFEYWRLAGKTPASVEELLRAEAQSRGGFFSGFFFNLCDYWYPCTDNRAVKSALIAALIGQVVEAYEAYVSGTIDAGQPQRNYLLITTDPTRGSFGPLFLPDAVATAKAGNVTAYAFLLRSR